MIDWIAQGVGLIFGLFLIYVVAWIAELVLWQRVLDDPFKGKLLSAATSWLLISAAASYIVYGDGSVILEVLRNLAIPAALVALFGGIRGWRLRKRKAFDASIFE